MVYFLIAVYMILIPITIIIMLYKILDKLEKMANIKQIETKRRTHPGIGKSNYNSILTSRKSIPGYDKYKNKNGLYEPVTPNNGIRIKKKED